MRSERFCDDHGIDAWYRADGEYVVAASDDQVGRWADGVITADRLGIDEHFQVLSAEEMRSRISSPVFRGALFRKVGATVHPARLARGMRRVLLERGVRFFEDTPVTRFGAGRPRRGRDARRHRSSRCRRRRPERMGLALEAVPPDGGRPRLLHRAHRSPRPRNSKEIGWTDGSGIADMRSAIHYVRTTPDGRISFGIGGMQPNLAPTDRSTFRVRPRGDPDRPSQTSIGCSPASSTCRSRPPGAARSTCPAITCPRSARSVAATSTYGHGYTGNGVGPAHLGGRIMANRILGKTDPVLDLPLVDLEPLRFPPQPVRSPGRARREHGHPPQGRGRGRRRGPEPADRLRREAPPAPRIQPGSVKHEAPRSRRETCVPSTRARTPAVRCHAISSSAEFAFARGAVFRKG